MTEIAGRRVPRHGVRILVIWLVLCLIAVPLIVFVLGDHLPPGRMSAEAGAQTDANTLLTALLVPIVLLVVVYFLYALVVFRARGDVLEDGPPDHGNGVIQLTWVGATALIVLALAIWGSVTLVGTAHGAGGGQGPSPTANPKGYKSALPVQVIGQQWTWTFRWPAYGAFETKEIELPVDRLIAFHVTSLDVTHSFWAYELGVKADAVPGVDNIAYVTPRKIGRFMIRCAELCGLWHGHMAFHGRVVSAADFDQWVSQQKTANKENVPDLGPYSRTYFPEPLHRAG
jgi:cytochrome c oxidase subunit II